VSFKFYKLFFILQAELRVSDFCVQTGFIEYFIIYALDFEKGFMERGVFSKFLALKVLFGPN
jgi:hypothetical protein